jgi:hypothetical protein
LDHRVDVNKSSIRWEALSRFEQKLDTQFCDHTGFEVNAAYEIPPADVQQSYIQEPCNNLPIEKFCNTSRAV